MAYDHFDRASPKRRSWLQDCFSCCFGGGSGEGFESQQDNQATSFVRSSSVWLRSKAQEIPELKDKCRGLISRIGKHHRQPGDFKYDPLSYALNFDHGADVDDADDVSPAEFRFRSFSSRLPPTPPHLAPSAGAEIIACN
ncbi:uncharacterized protein LOC144704751 [Wolffia australiana]